MAWSFPATSSLQFSGRQRAVHNSGHKDELPTENGRLDIRPLSGISFDALAAAFNDAFSDYLVPMAMTAQQLAQMQRRRGYVAEASMGAFDGERLVGFALTCIDGDRAYNSGRGVALSHRRRGIGRELMKGVIDLLAARGSKSYQLEVIEANERAAELYRAVGFEERRRFQCWTFESSDNLVPPTTSELANTDLDSIAASADMELSWQNSLPSIRRAAEPYVVLGDERGAVVIFPHSGDLPLLTVRRDVRRQGIGSRLLRGAAKRAAKSLRILNIDDRERGVAAFLEAAGARPLVRQIEMILAF